MFRQKLSFRFASLSMALFAAGCTLGGNSFAEPPAATSPATFNSEMSYQMYHTMAAEMMIREGLLKQAAQHYAAAATRSDDPALVRRATEAAIQAEETELAKKLLGHWISLEPDSMEIRQYRILLYSRLQEYDAAVGDVVWLRDHMEKKEGHGFEFVVSLLALEAGADNAYEIFRRYVDKVDDSAKTQLVISTLAMNANKYEAVLGAAEKVKQSGNAAQKEQATRLRARAFMALERTDEAVSELGAIVATTDDNDLKLEYGRMLIMADRRDEAQPVFQQLYADEPDNADILYTLGLLYLEEKEYAFAEPLMKKLLKVQERKHEASYFLAQIYEGQERFDDALQAYDEALNGEFARESIGRKAMLLQTEQSLDAARQWLDQQIEDTKLPARKLSLVMAKAQLLHNAEQYEAAIAAYDAAEAFGASKRDILYSRSLSYDRMGKIEAAEKDLRAIISDDPEDADALNALGYMLTVSTERYDEAKTLIAKALTLLPNSAAVLDSMGWVLYKLGDYEAAETKLRLAFTKLRDPEVASHLIEVLSRLGKLTEAQTILQEMLLEFPDDKMLVEVKERLAELPAD